MLKDRARSRAVLGSPISNGDLTGLFPYPIIGLVGETDSHDLYPYSQIAIEPQSPQGFLLSGISGEWCVLIVIVM